MQQQQEAPNPYEQLTKGFMQFAQNIQGEMVAIFKAIQPAIEHIHKVMYQSYLNDGACYGETQEGFTQWLKEMGEIRKLENQAKRIRDKQQHALSMREFGEKLRERREEREKLFTPGYLELSDQVFQSMSESQQEEQ